MQTGKDTPGEDIQIPGNKDDVIMDKPDHKVGILAM
jgi:hypothetical protein